MNFKPGIRAFALALFFCVLAGTAHAQDLGQPLLLVAKPELEGPYQQTALIVVPIPGGRHLGFILNRVTKVTLGTLFPDHPASAKVVDPVSIGGPEAPTALFAILRRDPGTPSMKLAEGLYVTGNGAAVDKIIEQTPNDARYFAGFVGWHPGELAAEIDKGYWYAAEPDAELALRRDWGGMWEELVKRLRSRKTAGLY